MKLSDLAASVPGARVIGPGAEVRDLQGPGDVEIGAVHADSRAITAGDLFVAVRGRRSDGHAFVGQAVARGAAAIVVEAPHEPDPGVPQVIVPDGALALGCLVGHAAGEPARRLRLVGITGTNGKTTTSYLVESILAAAGASPGVIGTVSYRWGGKTVDAPYTTPTPDVLHRTFGDMAGAGCDHAVMEVSSAALEMGRLGGVDFAVAAFSNLTQDHLDVHGTMEAYRDAKRLLFGQHLAADGVAVVNVDDREGDGMAAAAGARRVLRVSCAIADAAVDLRPSQRDAEIAVLAFSSTVDGITARIRTPRGALDVASHPLLGHYNVANIALAVGIGEALGLPHEAISRGIAELRGVPGRVERVTNDAGLDVLVDYAHTPDALDNVLRALRPLTRRRLICVFGCGGDRDPTKRPKMGAVVAALADLAVVTSDNPRTEQPQAILDMILPAVPSPFFVHVDRRIAIRAAVAEAVPGDIVVIAGKGHEDYQILGTTKIHFDDREEAAAAIALRPRFHLDRIAAALGGTVVTGGDGADVVCSRVTIDGRTAAPGDLYVAIRGETHDGHAFAAQAATHGARAVLVARGRGRELGELAGAAVVEVDDPRVGLASIAAGHRQRWREQEPAARLVAITGSAGKTTTKELTHAALAAAAPTLAARGSHNNETGVPLTVLGLRAHHRYAVVEMGMRGAGQIEYLTRFVRPDVAAIVNAGTAHIELLGSTDAIAEAKGEIYLGLADGGTAVAPADDDRLLALARKHAPAARLLTFGPGAKADVRLDGYRPADRGSALVVEALGARRELELQLLGRHAAVDATCALACALAAGVDLDVALTGMARTRPPSMRGELRDIGGRRVIVDCYNANPSSMTAAITMLAELRGDSGEARALAVVGDMLELGDHAEAAHQAVGALLREHDIPLVALGEHRQRVADAFGSPALAWTTDDPVTAARQVLAATEPGDWVLIKASRGMRLERVVAAMQELAA